MNFIKPMGFTLIVILISFFNAVVEIVLREQVHYYFKYIYIYIYISYQIFLINIMINNVIFLGLVGLQYQCRDGLSFVPDGHNHRSILANLLSSHTRWVHKVIHFHILMSSILSFLISFFFAPF